jgi:hypothetical protein
MAALETALGLVLGACGRDLAGEQLGHALIALLSKKPLGFGLMQLGLIDGVIQRDERRASLHRRAFLEMNLVDATGDLRADHHGLIGA